MGRDESTGPGQIVTFYSYKGGTGRSMAVANCAYWLAKNFPALARGVLVMDWDLEAPGLHRYFAETAELAENQERPGVVNYFEAVQSRLRDDPQLYERIEDEGGWEVFGNEFPLGDYLIRDVIPGVHLIKAGRYDSQYAELISTFNWVDFYHNYGATFSAFRDFLLHAYDYCLIDSRTGFNDVSGVCTMLLPEKLVTVFTPNRQNVSGVLDLAGRATDYRLGSGDPRTLSVFPLPSRIENAEQELRETWQRTYKLDFEAKFKSIYKLDACDLSEYFDDVQLPHVSFYSYGEEVALMREERSGALTLSRAYELFFEKLFSLKFAWDQKQEPEAVLAPVEPEVARDVTKISPAGRVALGDRLPSVQYDSDIYISYAHLDNRPLFDGREGWVDTFRKALEIRLEQLMGEPAKVWQDMKLRGNDALTESLIFRLSQINLFVAIVTPAYVKSQWCMKELTEFYRRAQEEEEVIAGWRSRIFKVLKTPVDQEFLAQSEVGELLGGTLGYEFYEMEKITGKPREFSMDFTRSGYPQFWARLDDLAYDIYTQLEKQRRYDKLPSGAAPTALPDQSCVYLAETTPDLEYQRDRVRRELEQRGYTVLPDQRLPDEERALREAVGAYLERCRLSVHLIGDLYGTVPDGTDRSVVEIQNEMAAERGTRAESSRVIWMPIGLQPHDERQREFVERLKMGAAMQRGDELLQTPLDDLTTVILHKLSSVAGKASPPAGEQQPVRIYLICDRRDADSVWPLENYLFNAGYEVIQPLFDGDEAEVLQYHKESLLLCDAVLIYYGHGSYSWLRLKLADLRKALGWGRAEPMLAQAVLVAGPETIEKDRLRTREAIVLKNFDSFDPETLRPLVEAIEKAREVKGSRSF